MHPSLRHTYYYSQGGGASVIASNFKKRVEADGGTFEAVECLKDLIESLGDFYDQASFILTPNGYKAQKLYALKPTDGSGDLTFSRSTTGYRIGASSLENELANVPRLSYRESSCPSLLLENARTNLLLHSDDLSNASWVKVNCTISSNAIAGPDGTTIADKIVDDTTNGPHQVRQNITKDNQVHGYTAFAFLKKGERNWVRLLGWDASANGVHAWFDLENGVKGTFETFGSNWLDREYGMIELYDDWYLCYIKFNTHTGTTLAFNVGVSTGDKVQTYVGNGTGLYFGGGGVIQYAGAFGIESYIPTVASPVQRGADGITALTDISDLIGQTEGTIYLKLKKWVNDGVDKYISLSDGTTDNAINIRLNDKIYTTVVTGGVTQASITSDVFHPPYPSKIVVTYQANKVALFVNGSKIGEDLTVTVPECSALKFTDGGGSNPMYAEIELLAISKTALSDSAAQTRTEVDDFADFLIRVPPTRYIGNPIVEAGETYINICPGGMIADPVDSSKVLFYMGEFLGPTTVGGRISLYELNTNDPFTLTEVGVVLEGDSGTEDQEGCRFGCVLNVEGTIYYYYVGVDASFDWRIMLATSTDGRTFTKQGVVMDFNNVDEKSVSGPAVYKDGDTWYMVYTGWDGLSSPENNNPGQSKIGLKLATSTDGITWTKTEKVLVPLGQGLDIDAGTVEDCQLLKYGDTWVILYNCSTSGGLWRIAAAISENINDTFTKLGTFFDVGSGWDATLVSVPLIYDFGNRVIMYYQGASGEAIDVGAAELRIVT